MAIFEVENGRLYQWDIGRTIKVSPEMGEAIDEVHFAYGTDEDALRRELHDGKAEIPNVLLQRHGQMRVWAVVNDEDGRQTIQNAYLNVRERNKPEDYIYTDEEVRRYEELEARLDEETGKYNEVDERLDLLENDKNYVISINGKMGEVELGAADVGAVESVNGEKGKVILSAEDVGALPVINGSISIGKTTSTTSNSFSINRRYDSVTTQAAKFGITGEELNISIIEKATPASGGTITTTGTISVSPRKTSFTTPLYFTSASVKGRTRENLDVYSKEEVDEAILEATKNNGDEEAVKIVPQELSTDQQEQARNNIDVYSKTEVDDIIEEIEIGEAVESVNGKTGEVVLTAEDVGAVESVNGHSGKVTLDADDVAALPKKGGNITGNVSIGSTSNTASYGLSFNKKYSSSETTTTKLSPAGNYFDISLGRNKDGSTAYNHLYLYHDKTSFTRPLDFSSSAVKSTTRDNLEVYSKSATDKAIEDAVAKIPAPDLSDYYTKSEVDEKIPAPYDLPTASADIKGGVKVGEGLQMDGDVLEVVPEGKYELIETITIDTDTTIVSRTQTPSGEDYCYKDVIVSITYVSEHERSMWARMKIWFDNNATLDAFRANNAGTLIGEQVMKTNRDRNFVTVSMSGITTNKGNIVPENSVMVSNASVYNSGNINRIDIDRQDGFFSGDILRIYAVKE